MEAEMLLLKTVCACGPKTNQTKHRRPRKQHTRKSKQANQSKQESKLAQKQEDMAAAHHGAKRASQVPPPLVAQQRYLFSSDNRCSDHSNLCPQPLYKKCKKTGTVRCT